MTHNFFIKNFGCRLNQHEGDIIAERMLDQGHNRTQWKDADVVIVNGCVVTARADRKLRQFIRKVHRENPDATILLTGCTAKAISLQLLPEIEGVETGLKSNSAMNMLQLPDFPRITGSGITRTRACLKIQDGCDRKCAYCIVPLVRGNSRSRPIDDIVEQVSIFVDTGFKEIVLTGVDIGDWRQNSLRLPDLMRKILDKTGIYRLRLSSLEPPGLTGELIELISIESRIAPHIHIPLQSGSYRLLREMNRPQYNPDEIVEKLEILRDARQDICFGTDIIIGYPRETTDDFGCTAELLQSGIFAYAHIFRFSPRPGTAAFKLEKIDNTTVDILTRILHDIDKRNRRNFARNFIGRKLEFIVERSYGNIASGRTANYLKVHAHGKVRQGDTADVMVKSTGEMMLEGEIVI